jgi:hypothetical protein
MKPENKVPSPFKTPEYYFEAFKVSVSKDLRAKDRSGASEFQDPFKTPAHYLKNFTVPLPQEVVLEQFVQTTAHKKISASEPKILSLSWVQTALSAAAVLVFLLSTPFIFKSSTDRLETMDVATIDQYWDYATDAITPYDMAEFIEDNSTQWTENSPLSEGLEDYLNTQLHPIEAIEFNSNDYE